MVKQINIDSAEAAEIEARVKKDEAVVSEKAALAQEQKAECEELLAEAVPALNAALSALNTLKKQDIDVVKTMKSPPAGVKLVMEAVCVMKDVKPEKVFETYFLLSQLIQINDPADATKKVLDYWGPAKKVLSDMKFLDSLREVDQAVLSLILMGLV